MAVQPTSVFQWANNDIEETKTINGSVETLPNKVEPTQEFYDSGLLYREPLPRPYLNFVLNLAAQWITYLEERADEHEATLVRDSIVAAAAKTTLVDADSFGVVDSEAANALKEVTFGNLRGSFPTPSTTGRSTVELATSAEAIAGIDAERAVTPAALAAALANLLANHLPSGTTTVFYQQNAPTGWTKSVSINDRSIIITSGSDGGTTGGAWAITGLDVLGHTLTVNQMPAHNHRLWVYNSNVDRNEVEGFLGDVAVAGENSTPHAYRNSNGGGDQLIEDEGGGASHDHGISHDGAWRPAHAKFILCVKN